MQIRIRPLLCGLLLLSCSVSADVTEPEAAAHVDRVNAVLDEYHPTPLRWDNVEGAPLWLRGERPQRENGLHQVRMLPGQSTTIRLPAGAWLRLHDPEHGLCAQEFEVLMGDGSGLYAVQSAEATDSPNNLLFDDPLHQERVAIINRLAPCHKTDGVRALALFVSRIDGLGLVAPYRDEIDLETRPVRVTETLSQETHRAYLIEPERPVPVELVGPLRVAIQTRLIYPQVAGEGPLPVWFGAGRIASNIDQYSLSLTRAEPSLPAAFCAGTGGAKDTGAAFSTQLQLALCHARKNVWRRFDFDTSPEYSDPVKVDRCSVATGRLETRYIDVPAGQHQFYLQSTSPVIVRLRAVPEDDYALSSANAPNPTQAQAQQGTGLAEQALDQDLVVQLDQAHAMAQDNTRREGAMRAARSLLTTPLQTPMARALREEGRRIWNRQTFYREILPYTGGKQSRAGFAWYLTSRLVPYYQYGKQVHTNPLFREADLKGLNGAYFVPWTASCGEALESRAASAAPGKQAALAYRLPERYTSSRMRVLLDLPADMESASLWAQFDDEPPVRLSMSRAHAGPLEDMLPIPAEAGLALLQAREEPLDNPGFWGQLADTHPAAMIIRPATAELRLPLHVKNLRLWSDQCPASAMRVALQYRTSKPFQLSESDYPALLQEVPPAHRLSLFLSMLDARDDAGQPAKLPWLIAGEYADHESASVRAHDLRHAGYDSVERVQVTADNRRIWQTLLGPLQDLDEARSLRSTLDLGKASTLMLPQDPESSVRMWNAQLQGRNSSQDLLGQHWLPLLRMLTDRSIRFQAGLAPDAGRVRPAMSSSVAATLINKAVAAESNDAVRALELYTRIARSGRRDSDRVRAVKGMITALSALGESNLMDATLRAIALRDPAASVRSVAREELLRRYRSQGDDALIQGLLSAAMMQHREQSQERALQLVEHLVEIGNVDFALGLGLLLQPCYRPIEAVVQAAFEARWWQVFEALLPSFPEASDAAYWRGMRAMVEGDQKAAGKYWTEAGQRGKPWLQSAASAEVIARRLRNASQTVRKQAINQWGSWASLHPGPRRWVHAPQLVHGHAGVQSLEVHSRNLFVTALRARPNSPVSLSVFGPARIKLELRPVHADSAPYNGWVHVEHNGRLRVLPYAHNRTIAGYERLDQERDEVGRAEFAYLDLGPGPHELRIMAPDRELLVRPHLWQPALPLTMLPNPSVETVAAVVKRGLPRASDVGRAELPRLGVQMLLAPSRLRNTASCGRKSLAALPKTPLYLDDAAPGVSEANMCTRMAQLPADMQDMFVQPPIVGPSAERWLSTAVPKQPAALLSHLMALTWWQEQKPEQRELIQAYAEAAYAKAPDLPGAEAVMSLLRRWSDWAPVDTVDRSAGDFVETVRGWQPDSPFLRVRKALLPSVAKDSSVLYGAQGTTYRFVNQQKSKVRVTLRLEELELAMTAAMTVSIKVDGRARERIVLGPDRREASVTIKLAQGSHWIELRNEQVYANQFIVVSLSESGGRKVSAELSRSFHVASNEEPIKLRLPQTAWLRLDRRQDDSFSTQYRLLEAGEVLTLKPNKSEGQVAYRIHQRRVRPVGLGPQDSTPIRMASVDLLSPTAPRHLNQHCAHGCRDHLLELRDYFPLGGQEDGTWGLAGQLVSRRPLNEDNQSTVRADEYFEADFNHWFYNERQHSFRQWQGLVRVRDDGSPTVGGRYWFDWEPRHSPYSLNFQAAAFAQSLDGRNGSSSIETAFRARVDGQHHSRFGTRVTHTVNYGLHASTRSLDGTASSALPLNLDQDVYTLYQDQHAFGCRLWDRWTYKPWLDASAFIRFGLGCNEVVLPTDLDYGDIKVGWNQRIGDLNLDLDYRFRRYFKDDDRSADVDRGTVHTRLGWDIWPQAQTLWALALDYVYDTDSGDSSVMLIVQRNRNTGRGYKDYRPGQINFKQARQQSWAAQWPNNWLGEDDRDY